MKGHRWSQWYDWHTGDKEYRYCYRCGEIEYRIGLMVVKTNPKEEHVRRNNMSRLRNMFNWLISLTKPSFRDSIDEAVREGRQQWYYRIPRDELNDAIKCLANQLSNIEDFSSPRLWLCNECRQCRYQLFCRSIIHSMEKTFEKYARSEVKGG